MRTWLAVGLILVTGSVAAAQPQRLGDIADSIRLSRDGEVVIDERAVAPSAARSPSGGLGLARTELAACGALGRDLLTVLRRSVVRDIFYDAGWRQQVRDSSLSLVGRVERLDVVQVPAAAWQPWEAALDDADSYRALTARMERVLATDTPDYRSVLDDLERTNAAIDRHIGVLASTERWIDRASTSYPPTGAEVDRVMSTRCGLFDPGSTDHTLCVDRQRRAADSLSARSRYTLDLNEATFNALRNRCAELHPLDFAERDRCERYRMTVGSSPGGT